MNHTYLLRRLFLAVSFLCLLSIIQVSAQTSKINQDRFEHAIVAYEQQDIRHQPSSDGIVFIGSSSVGLWSSLQKDMAPLPVIARGFGGSTLPEVFKFAPRIIYSYQPKIVVLYAGENDIAAGDSPEKVLQNFRALSDDIHTNLPETDIVFISIKPSVARWELWPEMSEANQRIKSFAQSHNHLHYVDVATDMLEDGQVRKNIFSADNLHMNEKGYEVWTASLKPIIADLWSGYEFKLPHFFNHHMVLQRGNGTPVWGRANPGTKISVAVAGVNGTTEADELGNWKVYLPRLKEGGPHTLTVKAGNQEKEFNNVMVGDVWLASGQSNMAWPLTIIDPEKKEIGEADYPNIRLFTVKKDVSHVPLTNVKSAEWYPCSPESIEEFSAVAYFFARELHQKEGVPIGIIHSSWGGTPAEAWTSLDMLHTLPTYQSAIEKTWEKPDNIRIKLPENELNRSLRDSLYDHAAEGINLKAHTSRYNDGNWPEMYNPNDWSDTPLSEFDGFVWFRKQVDLPDEWKSTPLTLSIGRVRHRAKVFFNGQPLEEIDNQSSTKVFQIPSGLAKRKGNVVAIQILNRWGTGGMISEDASELAIWAEDKTEAVSLAGTWKYNQNLEPAMPIVKNYQNGPANLYNAMIAPLLPFGLKGIIWYQGESNAGRAYEYRRLFPAMITDWRVGFQQGNLPFIFVQLANFKKRKNQPSEDDWAELREAQLMALDYPNTGMAVTIDIGEANDIHPKNKQDVGKRLALAAEKIAYQRNLVYSGPLFKAMKIKNDTVLLTFSHSGKGLVTRDGVAPVGFEIAGEDQKFHWAEARIINRNQIMVHSDRVPKPVAVRYAWQSNPDTNLYNQEGLPASPFRTDDWPGMTIDNAY